MAPGGEELGYTGSVEASLGKTECCSKAGPASSDDDGIIFVVLWGL